MNQNQSNKIIIKVADLSKTYRRYKKKEYKNGKK